MSTTASWKTTEHGKEILGSGDVYDGEWKNERERYARMSISLANGNDSLDTYLLCR